MSEISIVDNEYITVSYLPDEKIVQHTIHQPLSGQPFRDALNAGTAALAEYGACKWLSDDRKNGPLTPEDSKWGDTHWNRRTIDLGWKYWAMVVPEEIAAAGSLLPVMQDLAGRGLRVMVFTDPAEAMDWLVAQPAG